MRDKRGLIVWENLDSPIRPMRPRNAAADGNKPSGQRPLTTGTENVGSPEERIIPAYKPTEPNRDETMSTRYHLFAVLLFALAASIPAHAWNDEGHMAIAHVAYERLKPPTRSRVDSLLKLNPYYSRWLAAVRPRASEAETNLLIFMIAATWADQIKDDPEYKDDGSNGGNTPGGPQSSLNIGYSDRLRHKYWHFIDTPFSQDGTALPAVPHPDAEIKIAAFRKVLASGQSDTLKSYDLVWLEHLVGDVHQPLHAVTRVSAALPGGDAGGNLVAICSAPCRDSLHAFWDRLIGSQSRLPQPGKPSAAANLRPNSQAENKIGHRCGQGAAGTECSPGRTNG